VLNATIGKINSANIFPSFPADTVITNANESYHNEKK